MSNSSTTNEPRQAGDVTTKAKPSLVEAATAVHIRTSNVETPASKTYFTIATLLLTLLLAFVTLRLPYLKEGSPYLYREDEAHHFNRLVGMMKTGDLDPHYFHKPSLHFYLRLPALGAAFLWAAKKAELESTRDIITEDPSGLANYSFSVSHPRLLLVSRAFSVVLQGGCLLLTILLGVQLGLPVVLALVGGLLFTFSPSAIAESAVIGVDGVMAFFCLLCASLALRALKLSTTLSLFWASLAAGLAISSKYNAAPVYFVPLVTLLISKKHSFERWLTVLFVPVLGFLIASPYILFRIPEFLNQLAYEVWHYGTAGHVGHSAEPGLQQLLFYLNWLASEAVGYGALALVTLGVVIALYGSKKKPALLVVLVFPITFFVLMVTQRANFERNMTVMLPFLSIIMALGLSALLAVLKPRFLGYLLLVVALFQPAIISVGQWRKTRDLPETRLLIEPQLESFGASSLETAVDSTLQLRRAALAIPGVTRTALSETTPEALFQDGYDRVVVGYEFLKTFTTSPYFRLCDAFDGSRDQQRIVQNPALFLFCASDGHKPEVLPSRQVQLNASGTTTFDHAGGEAQLWLQKRSQIVELVSPQPAKGVTLELFTPWSPQQIEISGAGVTKSYEVPAGKTMSVTIDIPLKSGSNSLVFGVRHVHSPKALGMSEDARRLGVAIQKVITF